MDIKWAIEIPVYMVIKLATKHSGRNALICLSNKPNDVLKCWIFDGISTEQLCTYRC